MSSDGFIISTSAGWGTLVELVAAINANLHWWKGGKRMAILNSEPGWPRSESRLVTLALTGLLSGIIPFIRLFQSATEAVEWVASSFAPESAPELVPGG